MNVLDASSFAAVILAAGAGTRLRPLTNVLPKALCPVGNVPLVDHAIERARRATNDVAVNVHHGRDAMEAHLEGRVHLSIEMPQPLRTAGAIGNLRDWIDGRDVLVLNADAWHTDDLTGLLEGWDRERVRLLTVHDERRPDFGTRRYVGASLMPWREAARLQPEPGGLYEACWAPLLANERIEFVNSAEPFWDCGTIRDYHAANMAASGGDNVVGAGAVVEGTIVRTVLWPGVHVGPNEHLVGAIRARDDVTVTADHERVAAATTPETR